MPHASSYAYLDPHPPDRLLREKRGPTHELHTSKPFDERRGLSEEAKRVTEETPRRPPKDVIKYTTTPRDPCQGAPLQLTPTFFGMCVFFGGRKMCAVDKRSHVFDKAQTCMLYS